MMEAGTVVQTIAPPRAACGHPNVAYLGSGGNATYRQCLSCDATLISRGGRVWVLPRPARGKGDQRAGRNLYP